MLNETQLIHHAREIVGDNEEILNAVEAIDAIAGNGLADDITSDGNGGDNAVRVENWILRCDSQGLKDADIYQSVEEAERMFENLRNLLEPKEDDQ